MSDVKSAYIIEGFKLKSLMLKKKNGYIFWKWLLKIIFFFIEGYIIESLKVKSLMLKKKNG